MQPTEQQIADAKARAAAAKVDEVHLLSYPKQGLDIIVRKLTVEEFGEFLDTQKRKRQDAHAYATARAVLWPVDLEALRAQLPALDGEVSMFVRKMSGSTSAPFELEQATRDDLVAMGVPGTDADAMLEKYKGPGALAIMRQRAFGFACVMARPWAELYDSILDKFEVANREGGILSACMQAADCVVWSREPIETVLARLPGLAEDLFQAALKLGGLGASSTSKRL